MRGTLGSRWSTSPSSSGSVSKVGGPVLGGSLCEGSYDFGTILGAPDFWKRPSSNRQHDLKTFRTWVEVEGTVLESSLKAPKDMVRAAFAGMLSGSAKKD